MKSLFHFAKHIPQMMFNLMLSLSASAYVVVILLIKEEISFSFFRSSCNIRLNISPLLGGVILDRNPTNNTKLFNQSKKEVQFNGFFTYRPKYLSAEIR